MKWEKVSIPFSVQLEGLCVYVGFGVLWVVAQVTNFRID